MFCLLRTHRFLNDLLNASHAADFFEFSFSSVGFPIGFEKPKLVRLLIFGFGIT